MRSDKSVYAAALIVTLLSINASAQTKPDLSGAVTVDYCTLVREPASYDQKLIRVRTFYIVGFEASFFNKQDCKAEDVWVKFDPTFEKATKSKVLKRFNRLADASPVRTPGGGIGYPDRMVEVVAVGWFEGVTPKDKVGGMTFKRGFGHLGSFDFQFTVFSIEEVNALPGMKYK